MLQGWLQIALFLAVLVALTPLLGGYMARVYTGERVFLSPVVGPLERLFYRVLRVDVTRGQDWKALRPQRARPLRALLAGALPDPAHADAAPVEPGGLPLGHLGRDVQHGLVVRHEHELAVLRRRDDDDVLQPDGGAGGAELRLGRRRHLRRRRADPRHRRARRHAAWATSGRTWCARCCTCCCRSRSSARCVLVSQGTIQNFAGYATATTVVGGAQTIAFGPVASQEIIKELGTNGGGFFNTNSAMPFENPSGLLELRRAAGDPADPGGADGDLRAHGRQPPAGLGDLLGDGDPVRDRRRGRVRRRAARHAGAASRRRQHRPFSGSTGGNLEGKEQRFGIANSALWTAVTTVTSCGAVNAAFESLTGPRRRRAVREPVDERGRLRRRRHRAVLDAGVRPAGGLHRRPDGRPHARSTSARRSAAREIKLLTLGALFTPLAALMTSATAIASPGRAGVARGVRARRASRRTSTPTSRRPTTTARRGPATPATSSPSPATSARTASRSPTCSAA